MSNLPEGKIAVLLTPEQVALIKDNCEANENFAMNQLMKWSTLTPAELEHVKESFLKLDALKNNFRQLRLDLEAQDS